MATQRKIQIAGKVFTGFSALSLLSVSIMAFLSPQSVMDLVQVKLTNNDAYSSIRGVYGGVGLCLVIHLIFLLAKNIKMALGVLCMLWGFYAISRAITILAEGPLGSFGTQWIITESVLFIISFVLFVLTEPKQYAK
ncbi:MAG: DUF4345 domain-containing protein [Bacteroidia bacterium]|nr:DUF4345 domain-containing protein [Bacteroidia bacterium]